MKRPITIIFFLIILALIFNPLFSQGAGKALSFDGSDDYVYITGSTSLDLSSSYTIIAWVKAPLPNSAGYYPILWRGNSSVSDIEVYIQQNSNDLIIAHNRENAGTFDYVGFSDPPDNEWFQLAVVYGTNTVSVYYNGISQSVTQQSATGFQNPSITSGNQWRIGHVGASAFSWTPKFFNGTIDEVRIWNVARTQTQVRNWMHKTEGLTDETELVSVWHLDEGSGTSTDDPKGNNDGTINGATWASPSTAPFGTKGAFVATTTQTSVGPLGGQIKVTITSTPSDVNNLGLYQFGSLSGDPVTLGETFPSGFNKRSNIVWGIVERGAVTATLVFDYSAQAGVADVSTIEIFKRDDANDISWEEVIETSRDNDNKTITLTGVTSFSEYALGAGSDNSLPVELTSFTARQEGNAVVLEWVTESEVENLGFILYKRLLGQLFTWLTDYRFEPSLHGQGSTTNRTHYQYIDTDVKIGKTYQYQLVDRSYDGKEKNYGIQTVKIITKGISWKHATPNPFNPITYVDIKIGENTFLSIRIYDILGSEIAILSNQSYPLGEYRFTWDGNTLAGLQAPSGVYFIELIGGNTRKLQKVVLLR